MSDLSNCLCEITVTADSHEQANCPIKTRVLGLQKFVEELGGCFQVEHLGDGYGLDYKVDGYYNDKEISLGIEYKQFLNDFVPNHSTLEKRLGAAREHYDNIALVIEGESLARTSQVVGDKNIWYTNPAAPDGVANQIMNKQMFDDRVQAWTESGILVRNIRKEDDFPINFMYLLDYITKDDDWYAKHKIDLPNTSFKNQYINTILSFEIDKIGLKTAQKITKQFPNLYWLCTYSEDDLQDVLGKVTGSKLYKFIHNNELISAEWSNGGGKAKLSKETEKALKSNPEQYLEVRNPDLKYLDENKGKCIEVSRNATKNGKIDTSALIKQDVEAIKVWYPEVLAVIKNHPKGIVINKLEDIFSQEDMPLYILNMILKQLNQDGEIYEPKIGLIVATNPLQSSSVRKDVPVSTKQKALESDKVANLSDSNLGTDGLQSCNSQDTAEAIFKHHHNPPTSAVSNPELSEPPDNEEFKANPRLKDITEFIRKHPAKTDAIGAYFGLSPEYTLKALYELKRLKKVWFEKSTLLWRFGIDLNPVPVVADKEMEVL